MRACLAPVLFAALALAACGQKPAPPKAVLIETLKPPSPTPLIIRTTAFAPGGQLQLRNSAYGDNLSPSIGWGSNADAKTYALVVEDTDSRGPKAFVHWMVWNIPADITTLPDGLPGEAEPHAVPDAVQGRNDAGTIGWYGPRPPPGTGLHHYHFQVFALDAPLTLGADATRAALETAMRGHVVAQGELVGVYPAPKT